MRIGELARRAGASARSIRYYEQQGLLLARRRDNGYRDYDEADLRLVREIRSLLVNGFDLEEIRPFIDCLHAGIQARRACPGGIDVYRRKLEELDSRILRAPEPARSRRRGAVAARRRQRRAPGGSGMITNTTVADVTEATFEEAVLRAPLPVLVGSSWLRAGTWSRRGRQSTPASPSRCARRWSPPSARSRC